jgi:hypothetical protein
MPIKPVPSRRRNISYGDEGRMTVCQLPQCRPTPEGKDLDGQPASRAEQLGAKLSFADSKRTHWR